ncbi:hypothetical protein [Streptomyces sp. NPDC051636]|uniref:hypothetical protein n=1 Tax=Streptomyces sp. NPDC051636 TaxID=3365663 RepID=UPI0037A58BFE
MTALTTRQWLRTAADRVSTGSGRLTAHYVGRAARAVHGRVTSWPWWTQLGLTLLALYRGPQLLARLGDRVHERIASGAWGGLLFTAAGLWIVTAYRAGRDGWEPKQRTAKAEPDQEEPTGDQADDDEADAELGEAALEQAPAGPPLLSLSDLRISLAKVGTPHAHLAVLAEDLGTTSDRVREALTRWAIPVDDVRMRGRGTSTGVKGGPAAHPAIVPRPEDVAAVAAGQGANNNSNNTEYDFVTIPDEVNPARTHVVPRDQ